MVFVLAAIGLGLLTVFLFKLFPKTAMTLGGTLIIVLLGCLVIDALRRNKLERAWETELAAMACPQCSKPLGKEAAHLARKGVTEQQRTKRAEMEGVIIDNFGSWAVDCPHCKSEFSIEPESHELLAVKSND